MCCHDGLPPHPLARLSSGFCIPLSAFTVSSLCVVRRGPRELETIVDVKTGDERNREEQRQDFLFVPKFSRRSRGWWAWNRFDTVVTNVGDSAARVTSLSGSLAHQNTRCVWTIVFPSRISLSTCGNSRKLCVKSYFDSFPTEYNSRQQYVTNYWIALLLIL